MIDFIGKIFPMSDSMFTIYVGSQAIANPWFDLLCFVLILSASQSILFNINASTGGLDILAKIINKYTGISLGASVTFEVVLFAVLLLLLTLHIWFLSVLSVHG